MTVNHEEYFKFIFDFYFDRGLIIGVHNIHECHPLVRLDLIRQSSKESQSSRAEDTGIKTIVVVYIPTSTASDFFNGVYKVALPGDQTVQAYSSWGHTRAS